MEFLYGHAVLSRLVPEHVLTRVPVDINKLTVTVWYLKAYHWVAHKVLFRAIRMPPLIVLEADSAWIGLASVYPLSLAVSDGVQHAEPIQMILQLLEEPLW